MKKRWSESEIELIKENAKKGISYNEIGKLIGRSGKAITVMMQKLGYKFSDFYEKPKLFCQNCEKELGRAQYKFCCRSCAAQVNNTLFHKRIPKLNNMCCENCGQISKNNKYCSPSCHQEKRREKYKEKILNNDLSISNKLYRKFLIEEYGAKCMECGWDKINPITGKCPIELEHIDGNSQNNKLDNLKLLCPNCHSLTSTYKALNVGKGRYSRMQRYKEGKSY